ncbi:SGNH/GDSL hydrolase family protein [Neobacillus sp. D3-1R]|uniref:SGNH/GDSL hydrolase family protein n=1 Tax=Neobacillus sp. D3-1R TaxID=3445778 RepID=UPI003FA04F7B
MHRAFIFFFISIFLLSSCSQTTSVRPKTLSYKQSLTLIKQPIPVDFVPSNLNIVSIGDSLTQGVGDSTKRGGYIPYLKQKLEAEKGIKQVNFSNYGVKGNKTNDLLNRLKKEEIQKAIKASDMVIVTIGGNDLMKVVKENISHLKKEDFSPAKLQYQKNLIKIIASIRTIQPKVSVVVLGLYNPFFTWFQDVQELDEILAEWNQTAQNIISSYKNSYFVRVDEPFKNSNENLLYKDYFHPNDKGYSIIANQLYVTLTDKALNDLSKRQYIASKEEN